MPHTGDKPPQVYAMLFTDLLLLTKEVGAHLKVIQEPMYLSQLMIQDFNCDDGTEFHITVVTTQVSQFSAPILLSPFT